MEEHEAMALSEHKVTTHVNSNTTNADPENEKNEASFNTGPAKYFSFIKILAFSSNRGYLPKKHHIITENRAKC
jgi:hypothetical protein